MTEPLTDEELEAVRERLANAARLLQGSFGPVFDETTKAIAALLLDHTDVLTTVDALKRERDREHERATINGRDACQWEIRARKAEAERDQLRSDLRDVFAAVKFSTGLDVDDIERTLAELRALDEPGVHECASSHVPRDTACRTFELGDNGRCVYCDHEERCHPGPGATCWIGGGEDGPDEPEAT